MSGIPPLPRLMDGSLREIARLRPEKLSLTRAMQPLSTAEMTLPPGESEVTAGMFAELFDAAGSAGIFRVTQAESVWQSGAQQRVTLEHGLATLSDTVMPGYTEFSGMSAGEVLSALLSRQSLWRMDACEAADRFSYSFENENLLTALLSLTSPMEGQWLWVTDQSSLPWKLSLRRAPEEDACECRLNRNLQSVKVTVDRSGLCTRVYPLGYGEGADQLTIARVNGGVPYLDADTQSAWGIVESVCADPSVTDAQSLKSMARQALESSKNPRVTVELDASDLSSMTGEAFDSFYPGRLCRLPIPAMGLTLSERIVRLTRPDVYGDPARVRLTLANQAQSAADALAELSRKSAVSALYSQGAASQYALTFSDNADAGHPALMKFFIDPEAAHVNAVKVKFSLEPFRAYSKSASAGGGGTATTDEKAWSNTAATGYALDTSGSDMSYTDSGGGTTAAPHLHKMKHYHVVRVSFDLPKLTVQLAAHTHPIEYGIYEGGTASAPAVSVDGNAVPSSVLQGGEFDAAGYLSRDADGRIERGAWHTVAFTPDAMTRITASVYVRTFLRSLSGVNL